MTRRERLEIAVVISAEIRRCFAEYFEGRKPATTSAAVDEFGRTPLQRMVDADIALLRRSGDTPAPRTKPTRKR